MRKELIHLLNLYVLLISNMTLTDSNKKSIYFLLKDKKKFVPIDCCYFEMSNNEGFSPLRPRTERFLC